MTVAKPVTVNEMIEALIELRDKGYGEAKILVPKDDEFNGVRELYETACAVDKRLKYYIDEFDERLSEEVNVKAKNFIVLG